MSLLVLENPLLDIQAVGDEALLNKYGLKANDAILADENKHMGIYQELLDRDAKIIAGGAAQNSARGAAYMLPPNSVIYLGAVGKDKEADQLRDACTKAGVRTEYYVDEKEPTGKCGVVITGHDRSMCTHLAAANTYKIEHLKSEPVWNLVKKAEVIYVGAYHLTVNVPAILALGEEAAKSNKIFMMGMGAPFIAEFFKDPLAETSKYWDYIVGNETEARTWAKSQGHNTEDVRQIAQLIADLPKANEKRKRTAIITQGTEETVVAIQGEKTLQEFPVHAIDSSKINDTNGAGDAFAGGFLSGLVEGKSLKESVDRGQWLAALSIQELGPSYPATKKTYTPSS